MSLPGLAELWPPWLTRCPNFLSPPDDNGDPSEDDEDGDRKEYDQNSRCPNLHQGPRENERRPEEKALRDGSPTARILGEFGDILWEISVYEDGDPDGHGEKDHRPPGVLLLPESCFKTVLAPEGADRIPREVDVDGRAYDSDKDYSVEPGETPLEEGSRAGD